MPTWAAAGDTLGSKCEVAEDQQTAMWRLAIAGNCAASVLFTFVRFARIGASRRRAERTSDTPPNNLVRRPWM
jgi:hypothetical protein